MKSPTRVFQFRRYIEKVCQMVLVMGTRGSIFLKIIHGNKNGLYLWLDWFY